MKNLKNSGFTLAEVLITLAIIGVVAAITIPSIVANHQKRTLETQFTKAYRSIQQVVNLATAEHGGIETWEWSNLIDAETRDTLTKKYFLPYLNYVKFCDSKNPDTGCFIDTIYKYLNGTDATNISKYTTPKVLLADGSSIDFNYWQECLERNTQCLVMRIDINGHKKPNTYGRDLFEFDLFPQTGEFLPRGINDNSSFNEARKSFTKSDIEQIISNCNENGSGNFCGARIVSDGFKINY